MRTTQQISINLSKAWIAKLREMAHKESLATGKEVIYTDLIRRAVEKEYELKEDKNEPDQTDRILGRAEHGEKRPRRLGVR